MLELPISCNVKVSPIVYPLPPSTETIWIIDPDMSPASGPTLSTPPVGKLVTLPAPNPASIAVLVNEIVSPSI